MYTLTPTAAPAPATTIGRLAALHERASHRKFLGVRVSAIVEVVAFLALALVIDAIWGRGERFVTLTPHPFWIAVLFAASFYGLREALFAAVVCAMVMLAGNVPAQAAGEGNYVWLLRVVREPLMWLVAAILLGEIRDALRRHAQALREEVAIAQDRTDGLIKACDRLMRQKENLETRIADQTLTVHAMYQASRAIERDGVGDVLVGVGDLVRTSLSPRKFSLYLLNGQKLEAAVSEGWTHHDRYARVIDAASPLFEAIVSSRRHLVVVDPDDETLLRDEGILAGPIVDTEHHTVVGMLKIEAMDFMDLTPASVQNFKTLCEWIGAAISNAQRLERTRRPTGAATGRVAPASMLGTLTALLSELVLRARIEVAMVHLELIADNPTRDPQVHAALTAAVDHTVQQICEPGQLCVSAEAGASFVLLWPHLSPDAARGPALRFVNALRQTLEDRGLHAMVRHRIGPLVDARQAA